MTNDISGEVIDAEANMARFRLCAAFRSALLPVADKDRDIVMPLLDHLCCYMMLLEDRDLKAHWDKHGSTEGWRSPWFDEPGVG